MDTAVTQKGQVTIPKAVRDEMGLKPGARVQIELDGQGGARIVHAPAPVSRFARFRGIAKSADGLTTDEIMRLMRGDLEP